MGKISPDGFIRTDIFSDLSIFNFNNIYMGQYAAKINKGSNNLIIGNNAGKIGIGLNNSMFIGANAGSEYLDADNVISIGDIQVSNNKINTESINIGYNIRNNSNGIVITNDKQHPQLFLNNNGSLDIGIFNQGITETSIGSYNSNLKATVTIGNSNISTVNNSIVIGNSIRNDKFSLNIDDILCKDDGGIYIGCGIYKDLPIILGSSSNNFTSNNLDMGNNFISSVFKIKNDTNTSISFITNTNQNIIYNLPLAPKYEYSFLSTDAYGNLEWVELSKAVITDINTTAHIICNNLESSNLTGDGSLITAINISNNTTDNLKEGLNNLYLTIHSISKIFYSYIQSFTTNDIKNGNSNNYFSFDKYSSNFYSNLRFITTDNIRSGSFYSSNDYYSNSSNYLLSLNTDLIKEGVSNLYYNPSNITTDFIKEGFSNLYYNESLIKINISNTDYIREGSSNLYFNQSLINSNIQFINTDFLKQGNSNLYATDYNIYNYFNSNIPTTDFIIQGTSNDYFNNISNQDKYSLISDKISEGSSNIYYKSSNQITGIIAFNTNTDLYNEGKSNLYHYENRGISDFLKVINSNITTDNFSNGTTKKFIKNNFYNNNLQITGFLKANNVNDLDKEYLRSNLEPKIGPLTEVYQVYDFERLSVVGRLSNIEIGYTTTDNSGDIKVPFIVIDNNVGINNSNPKYQLDVNGSINCSNLLIDNSTIYNITSNLIAFSNNQIYNSFVLETINTKSELSNILSNTSNNIIKDNTINYYTKSELSNVLSNTSNNIIKDNIINYYTKSELSNIFVTSNILSNTSNDIVKNSINLNTFGNYNLYFNNSNIGINNKNPLYSLDINSEINIYSNIRNDNNLIISNSKINVVIPPLIWFKFDYSSNWLVDSMGGNSLGLQFPTRYLNEVIYDSNLYKIGGGSAKFNSGNQTLILSNGADIINTINTNNGISISFWIYGYYNNIFGNYLRFYLITSSGNYNIIISGINNIFNIQLQTPQGNYRISNIAIGNLNIWNLIILIIQKDGIWNIYSNGVLISTFIPIYSFPSVFVTYSGNTMIIGNSYMNIDDFRIYSGILTNSQIAELNNNNNVTIPKYIISSDIFVTSNVLSNTSNQLFKSINLTSLDLTNYYTTTQISNIFVTSNVLSDTSNQLFESINIQNSFNNQITFNSNVFFNGNININNTKLPVSTIYSNITLTSNGLFSNIPNNSLFGYHTFITDGTITFLKPTECDIVVVGAGGNGGLFNLSGGGGAGEVIAYPSYFFETGTYKIQIGNINNKNSIISTNNIDLITAKGGGNGSYDIFRIGGTGSAFTSNITGSTNDYYIIFTTGTTTLTLNMSITVDILVIGGGGGGGASWGAGGGAGALIYKTNYILNSGTYTISIGDGGNGGTGTLTGSGHEGSSGSDTSIINNTTSTTIFLAKGGGGGGAWSSDAGKNGGSGGGSSGGSSVGISVTTNIPQDSDVFGNNGGDGGSGNWIGGGGGGAGAVGSNASISQPANGGIGKEIAITGINTFYAGGGGGGGSSAINHTPGTGGSGGGGNGGNSNIRIGENGIANTGGGGGGAYFGSSTTESSGGSGGSGVVILKYNLANSSFFASSGGSGGGGLSSSIGTVISLSNAAIAAEKWNNTYSFVTNGSNGTLNKGGDGGSATSTIGYTETITTNNLIFGVGGTGATATSIPSLKTTYGSGGDGNGGQGTQGIVIIKIPLEADNKLNLDCYINYSNIINIPSLISSNVLFNNLNKMWVINDGSNIYNNNLGNIGIGTTKPTYKLHVIGNMGVSGTVTQGFSDIRLKNKIGVIDKPFSIIDSLEGFYYTPNDLAVTFGFDSNNREVGLNALDAKKVIPEVVSLAPFDINENKQSKSGENYLTISYEKLVPVLLEGLKELKKEVEYLKNELKYR